MAVVYPLPFPAIPPGKVKASLRRVQSSAQSPFTLQQQVFDWNASRWEISVTMQKMGVEDAALFGRFIHGLNGIVGTFTFNLTPWTRGVSPAPGVRTFRLSAPTQPWDSDLGVTWDFQFDAVEVV
ncbi:hypothetical protein OpiT1DRAFT_01305 [Opitutaceae bacterium TAV1]|nr:hypothetical protein OpiT1DRAFT_01305 [Opitutaceae bacterium TAV1]